MNLFGREGFLLIFWGYRFSSRFPILEDKRFCGLLLLLLLLRTTSEVGRSRLQNISLTLRQYPAHRNGL